MAKKGFIHIIPLLLIIIGITAISGFFLPRRDNVQKETAGKVLSSSNSGNESGSSGSGKSDSNNDDNKSASSNSSPGSSGSGSGGSTKIESQTTSGRTKITTSNNKTKVEVRNETGRFETKIENGKEETKIRIGGLRIEFKKEGDKVVSKVKNEVGEEVEAGEDEKAELVDEIEKKLENEDIHIATQSAELGFIQKGHRVRTNFPLSIRPDTGELFITTPAGEKVVTILPDTAIQNMIAAGVLTRVTENPSSTSSPPPPPGGTSEATVAGAGVELTTQQNQPVFVISGVKRQRFLGIVPVNIPLKAVVSAENGTLVSVQQGLFSRFIDLIAF